MEREGLVFVRGGGRRSLLVRVEDVGVSLEARHPCPALTWSPPPTADRGGRGAETAAAGAEQDRRH